VRICGVRLEKRPSYGSSVQALFTEPSTNQATPWLAHNFAAHSLRYYALFLAWGADGLREGAQTIHLRFGLSGSTISAMLFQHIQKPFPALCNCYAHQNTGKTFEMVGDLFVSPIVPSRETLYPASPSLQWVPWASVPRLPAEDIPGIGAIVS